MRKRLAAVLLVLLLVIQYSAVAETLTISFIGDCSIGEAIQYRGYDDCYTDVLERCGFDWPFSTVYPILTADDMSFANLEIVFTNKTRHQDKRYPLAALPEYAEVLLHSGIDVVNTANNHAYDFFIAGYEESMQTLDALHIPHFGSFNLGTREPQDLLFVQEVKGIMIGALGFSYPQDSDMKRIENRIQSLREQGCDLVVVSLHWGRETKMTPESYQIKYARQIMNAGADIIWGHHPHVIQPVQFYDGKPVMYSTGNFTFGTMSAVDPSTGIFQLQYSIDDSGITLASFSVVPCQTQGSGDYRPYILTDPAERSQMLQKLIYSKEYKGFTNLPDSFAQTGEVTFSDGVMDD